MNDDANIYELYAESAHAQNEQPQMQVDANGNKRWYLHGELHREDAPAVECADGTKRWYLHGELHREDGPAIEYADGYKIWYLHDVNYDDANAWARDVLKMHNKPHDAEAVQKYIRHLFTKDDLI
jgi:hypothetical protein